MYQLILLFCSVTEIARYDFVKIEENKKIGKYCYHFLDAASLILREIADRISGSECCGRVGPGNPQLELAPLHSSPLQLCTLLSANFILLNLDNILRISPSQL